MIKKKIAFSLTVNGEREQSKDLPAHWRLIDYLHEALNLTGTKFGCGGGMCKACTVAMIDDSGVHHAIPACATSLETCNGWSIRTVEGLASDGKLHPLQSAFIEKEVFQCGYCTPGFLMEAFCLLENRRKGYGTETETREAVLSALEAHLCRCTSYKRYVDVVIETIKNSEIKQNSIKPKPYNKWKLIRWLHEAAEIENALMLQYLYAAFSIKQPRYSNLAGIGHRTPGQPHTLLAVAIEEMLHLDTVNRLLVALGAAPNLVRQDFPYEPRIYPFEFRMEPLSKESLARYCLAEAPHDLKKKMPKLYEELHRVAGCRKRINNVGSFYRDIRLELKQYGAATNWKSWQYWDAELENVQEEGEHDHFDFFLSIYNGEHSSFFGWTDVWNDQCDDRYPAYPYEHKTMWQGHENSLPEGPALELAKLSNLHYWLTMSIMELSYRNNCQYHAIARRHMAGPLLQICWHLPENFNVMPPFDKSSLDFQAGLDEAEQFSYILSLIDKICEVESENIHYLPTAYLYSSRETRQDLLRLQNSSMNIDNKNSS